MTRPHEARHVAESFGIDPERYDRARPAYPQELIDHIVAVAGPEPHVLDVGCGTGLQSRQFQAAGCAVLGVDPDDRMAAYARRSGVEVETAAFETWEPRGRTFDAVVAAQSWHWVDPVAGAAKAAEVLKPGGVLALFAHAYDPPAEIAGPLTEALTRLFPDAPFPGGPPRPAADLYGEMFDGFADGIASTGLYGEPERRQVAWSRAYTRQEWLDFLPTTGTLTRLTPAQLEEVLAPVAEAIDAAGGGFTLRCTTPALLARLG